MVITVLLMLLYLIDCSLLLVFCALRVWCLAKLSQFWCGLRERFSGLCCKTFLVIIILYKPKANAAMNVEINKEENTLLDLKGTRYLSVQSQNPRICRLRSSCVMGRNISSVPSMYICSFCKRLLSWLDTTVSEWPFFIW